MTSDQSTSGGAWRDLLIIKTVLMNSKKIARIRTELCKKGNEGKSTRIPKLVEGGWKKMETSNKSRLIAIKADLKKMTEIPFLKLGIFYLFIGMVIILYSVLRVPALFLITVGIVFLILGRKKRESLTRGEYIHSILGGLFTGIISLLFVIFLINFLL
jgi:hypothetical protein